MALERIALIATVCASVVAMVVAFVMGFRSMASPEIHAVDGGRIVMTSSAAVVPGLDGSAEAGL